MLKENSKLQGLQWVFIFGEWWFLNLGGWLALRIFSSFLFMFLGEAITCVPVEHWDPSIQRNIFTACMSKALEVLQIYNCDFFCFVPILTEIFTCLSSSLLESYLYLISYLGPCGLMSIYKHNRNIYCSFNWDSGRSENKCMCLIRHPHPELLLVFEYHGIDFFPYDSYFMILCLV